MGVCPLQHMILRPRKCGAVKQDDFAETLLHVLVNPRVSFSRWFWNLHTYKYVAGAVEVVLLLFT